MDKRILQHHLGTGSFAYENITFMSQIRLPEGRLVSYPTMAFGMVGDAGTEREAVERVFDHVRKKLTHFTGDKEDFSGHLRAAHGHALLARAGVGSPRGRGGQPVVQPPC